jgi:hypothetical protein
MLIVGINPSVDAVGVVQPSGLATVKDLHDGPPLSARATGSEEQHANEGQSPGKFGAVGPFFGTAVKIASAVAPFLAI